MDDLKLVQDCIRKDAAAQKLLYERFCGPMLGICYRYTKSMSDAEDILQEGFIKAFQNLKQYRGEGGLGAWLRRIMVTTALNYLKKASKYQTELAFDNDHLHPVSTDNPEISLHAKELAALIRQLPLGYQTIFNLHAVEGFSHVEIGSMLGIHEGTSRSQYARARALLISWIEARNKESKPDKYARTRF